jgi:hypothetical protein
MGEACCHFAPPMQAAVMGISYTQLPPEVKAALLEELEGKA